jgi:hypothetical protein
MQILNTPQIIKWAYRYFICGAIIIATLLITNKANCQNKLTGRIFEYKTRKHLPYIRIENLNTSATAISDTAGKFSIAANPGDKIKYSGLGYLADTVYLTKIKDTEVFLLVNMLDDVNIKSTKMSLGYLGLEPLLAPFGGETLVYTIDKNRNYVGGVTLKLWNKRARDKSNKNLEELQLQEKIGQIFSAQNLKSYLPISGQEMANFIILYTPDVKAYNKISNLIVYLNDCYKEFIKLPIDKRQSKEFLDLKNY